jgi:hypothetical protein
MLENVRDKVTEWQKLRGYQAFLKQTDIADDIKRLHTDISNCFERLQARAVSYGMLYEILMRFSAKDHSADINP